MEKAVCDAQMIPSECSRSSAKHSCTAHLFWRRGTRCFARARTTGRFQGGAGQERYREVFSETHLRGVSNVRVQLGLTRVREAETTPSPQGGMCVLRRFVQGSAGLSSTQHHRQAASASCRWFVTNGFLAMALLHSNMFGSARQRSATVVIVRLHRLPTSTPALVDLAPALRHCGFLASMSSPRRCSPVNASGRPPQHDVPGHVAMGARRCAVCARRNSRLASSSSRAPPTCCAPAPTTNAVSVPLHGQKKMLCDKHFGMKNTTRVL